MKNVLQRAKRALTVFLVVSVLATLGSLFPAQVTLAAPSGWDSNYWQNVNWGSNWKTWSQSTATGKMAGSGCWVVAYSKLLKATGKAPTTFNPGVFVKWEYDNGYIGSEFDQINGTGGMGSAPTVYAKLQGGGLSRVAQLVAAETPSLTTESALLARLRNGEHLIVQVLSGAPAAHWVYVDGDASLKANPAKLIFLDYDTTTSLGSKSALANDSRKYQVYRVLAYTAITPDTTTTAGNYLLKNGSSYLTAASDKDGGNVNVAAKNGAKSQTFTAAKSGASYYFTSQNSSSGRVLNPYADASKAGTNVTLYRNVSSATQRWVLEKSGSAFIIHPEDNQSVALTVLSGDVKLAATTGAASQLWQLEPVVNPNPDTDTPKIVVSTPSGGWLKQGTDACKITAMSNAINALYGKQVVTRTTGLASATVWGSYNSNVDIYRADTYVGTKAELVSQIDAAIAKSLPIVVAVHYTGFPHHWVTVIGKSASGYTVIDPSGAITKTITTAALGLTDYSSAHYGYVTFKATPTVVEQPKTPTTTYFAKYTGKSNSIVDGLNAIKVDSSYTYRSKIAVKNGITNYTGTAAQNTTLLNKLKAGTLIKP
jgi:hypothetical protein